LNVEVMANGTVLFDPAIRVPELDDGDVLVVERMSDGRMVLKKVEGANGKLS